MTEEKIIMYDSPEIAEKTTIEVFKSVDGKYFLTEASARYHSCTHKKCECGKPMKKPYTKCDSCRIKAANQRYNTLPFKEYDGSPVCDRGGGEYFFSEDQLIDYMEENDLRKIDLLFCDANLWRRISADYWSDLWPDNNETGELPKEIDEAVDNLNAVLAKAKPLSYQPGKIRTSYKIVT